MTPRSPAETRDECQLLIDRVAVAATKKERERVRRLADHHLAGIVVDDDVRRRIDALREDITSGVDRRTA